MNRPRKTSRRFVGRISTRLAQGQFPGYGPFGTRLGIFEAWAIRRYPMVVKVHARITMPILSGSRTIEIVDDGGDEKLAAEIKKAAEDDLLPILEKALPEALESPHFGYWLQELIWGENEGRLAPVDVQTILPGEGVIHIDEYRRFVGFNVNNDFRDARYGFLATHRPHIDPILGESNNMAALTTWYRATKSAENADAVERKAAGIQMLWHVAQGVEFKDPATGNVISQAQIVQSIMDGAVSGKSAILDAWAFSKESIEKKPELAALPIVRNEQLDWGDMGPTLKAHLDRKRELDVDICSAWGVPERAVMEASKGGIGQSDAKEHSDVVLCICENMHQNILNQWDKQPLPLWLNANYPGTKVKIRTKASPLADPQQEFMQDLVKVIAADPTIGIELKSNLDQRKLLERIEAPVVSEEDAQAKLADMQQKQQDQEDARNEAAAKGTSKNGNPRITAN